jgi:hypothetical protein
MRRVFEGRVNKREGIGRKKDKPKKKVPNPERYLEIHSDLLMKFFEITEKKILLNLDDYGDEDWSILDREVEIFLDKLVEKIRRKDPALRGNLSWLARKKFGEFHALEKKKGNKINTAFEIMTGQDFELYIKSLLEGMELKVSLTPSTGDQGADLVLTTEEKRIVIQIKKYEGLISNSAVQEVIAAKSYYDAQDGWVITNSDFTKSAKQLAQKANIALIDGHDMRNFSTVINKLLGING